MVLMVMLVLDVLKVGCLTIERDFLLFSGSFVSVYIGIITANRYYVWVETKFS